jgi:hypothetical protein
MMPVSAQLHAQYVGNIDVGDAADNTQASEGNRGATTKGQRHSHSI